MIAVAQYTIADLNDPIVLATQPIDPVIGALWLDIGITPNQLKRWDGSQWLIINDTSALAQKVNQAELDIDANTASINAAVKSLNTLSGRVQSAEQKITPEAITQTVRDSQGYKNDIAGATMTATKFETFVQGSDGISKISQQAGRVDLIISSDSTASELTFTDRAVEALSPEINLQANEQFTVAVGDLDAEIKANKEGIQTNAKNIQTNADNIETNAQNIETNAKLIKANAEAIELRATKNEVNKISGIVTQTQSTITQHGDAITMLVGQVEDIDPGSHIFRQDSFPTSLDGVKPNDILVMPTSGRQYQAVELVGADLKFYLGSDGSLYYTLSDASGQYVIEMQGYDMYSANFTLNIDEEGNVGTAYIWELVRDLDLQAALAEQAKDMADAVTAINNDIASLQDQIDGNITTYFYDYLPTTTNIPASDWATDADKNMHIGDLFYVNNPELEQDGYCYRWQLTANGYEWVLVKDTDVTKALADAKEAKDIADSKRRVFVTTPTPPYDVGDIWTQGSGGDILRCQTAKASGSYNRADWVLASKYTDDTMATQAYNLANAAVARVDVEYYLSTSSKELAGGSWSTSAPEWVNGYYMWSRTTTTLKNGTTVTSNAVCIAGAKGATGNGIREITEEFYLSHSKLELTGGEWQTTMPTWSAGTYIWTRSKIIYTDNTTTYTTPYCDSAWELAQELSVWDGIEPPPQATAGKIWLDRSLTPAVLKRWLGNENIETSDPVGWEVVNDTATLQAAQDAMQAKQAALEAEQKKLATYWRVDTEMVRIGKVGVTSEFQIDAWGAGVAINNKVFSRFEADRVRFGNMEMRCPTAGGLLLDSVQDLEVNMLGN